MPTGTRQLAFQRVAVAGGTVLYSCPVGYRTIVKEILFYPEGGGALTATLFAANQLGAVVALAEASFTSERAAQPPLARWSVLHAGDRLQLNTSSAIAIHVLISGTELLVTL